MTPQAFGIARNGLGNGRLGEPLAAPPRGAPARQLSDVVKARA
jgi:hypothetical protein